MVMILWAASFITSRMIGATWMSSTGRENESAFSPAGAFCRPTARAMARGSRLAHSVDLPHEQWHAVLFFGLSRKPTEAAPNDSVAGGILRDMPDREAIVLRLLISPLPSFPAIV